jgi:hypothetical protein
MNVLLRPSGLKLIRHRDMDVVKHKKKKSSVAYLSIITPNSKPVIGESISRPTDAVVYSFQP